MCAQKSAEHFEGKRNAGGSTRGWCGTSGPCCGRWEEQGVSRIYADPAKRLELYFRPKDPYCHPVCANRFPTSTVLLRVKRRTKKTKQLGTEEEMQPEVQFEMEIVGTVTTVYKFQGRDTTIPRCLVRT
ncbi:general transcription factor 3C polypeptide 5-like [Pelecanus crispus]|uniref:general transcription factor 3C polypeptide 5-like n=1 Tax=Pelecanus crispus TaxID=36300 RepID=UPI003F5D2242